MHGTLPKLISVTIRNVVGLCAIVLAFLSYVNRPDSFEEMEAGVKFCWIITGGVWAVFAFLMCRERLGAFRHRIVVAVCSAVVVWLIVGFGFSSWERQKVRMRLGPKFPELYQRYKSGR